jgi:hypothetical protein
MADSHVLAITLSVDEGAVESLAAQVSAEVKARMTATKKSKAK